MTKIVSLTIMILVTPKAGLLNKSSRLAPALGAANFITIIAMYLVTLCCAT